MSGDDRLDSLAGSVSDGQPVDWTLAASDAKESERASIRALQEVERIAEFNRFLQRSPGPIDGGDQPGDAPPLQRWGDLTLLEPIGAGANGLVWRAWDSKLRREVALKFLSSEESAATGATAPSSDADPAAGSRLLDEARALARVRHPGVVTVFGIAETDGRAGMWMEHLHGSTLAAEIDRRGPLPPREVARIGLELCRALVALDAAGLVHQDIKPSNIVLEPGGRVVLTDFGLGLRRGFAKSMAWRVSGTPMFMSPELLAGEPATPRSDLYALGVTLRWALTGHAPFRARDIDELIPEAKAGPATPLASERPGAPKALIAAIDRAMAPKPEARFPDAAVMAEAFEKIASPGRARPSLAIPMVALAAIVLVAVIWIALRHFGERSSDAARQLKATESMTSAGASPSIAPASYEVEATLVDRSGGGFRRLAPGDRVAPGNRLSLEFHGSRPMWVYVLNQDETGEMYLLFPQPLFDLANPISPESTAILPGPIGGLENAWTVTSRGGRENFLIVASPRRVGEIESELDRLPAAKPGRAIRYASIRPATVERLRGVGGVDPLPAGSSRGQEGPFERFEALAGRETVSDGIWVRRITLVNPLR
jgi:hypothetical protein